MFFLLQIITIFESLFNSTGNLMSTEQITRNKIAEKDKWCLEDISLS